MLSGFQHIWWLYVGVICICVLLGVFFFRKKSQNFGNMQLLEEVYKKSTYLGRIYFIVLITLTFLFFIILAGPYKESSLTTVKKNGIDIELVFDVSYSMNAKDILPSRMEVAKKVFSDFIGKLQTDQVGVILFAGKPFQSVPLSYDYSFLQNFISGVSTDIISQNNPYLQGTAIGDALVLASDVLLKDAEKNKREKVIILITDGEANKGIKPELALKYIKEKNIKVYSIGVGKDEASYVEVPSLGGFVQKIPIGAVDETMLKKISKETGGKYFRADSPKAFEDIFDQISALEKSEIEYEQIDFHSSISHIFIYILLGLFLIVGYFIFIKKIRV